MDNITLILITITIIITIIIGTIYLKIKWKTERNTTEIIEQTQFKTNQEYLLYQINKKLNIIIFLIVLPFIWKIIKIIYISITVKENIDKIHINP